MLLNLSAKNFILIDQLDLDFAPGMHAITGETGAGKSILLDAILFCLGYKFDVDIIKAGTESCVVSITSKTPPSLKNLLEEHAIDYEDNIILKRQQTLGGKKKFFINDQIVTQKFVDQVASQILEIHGQNTHSNLLDVSSHLKILDSYGQLEKEREEVSSKYKVWQGFKRELEEIEKERGIIDREIEYLRFIVDELVSLSLKPNEEEELANTRTSLQKQERDAQVIKDILDSITSPDIQVQISQAQKIIYRQIKDSSFEDVLASLEQASIHLSEAVSSLEARNHTGAQVDLDSIEERLFAIRGLARKHGVTSGELSEFLHQSETKLAALLGKIHKQSGLENQIKDSENDYRLSAKELSTRRKDAAQKLEDRVAAELSPLKMTGSIFKVEFKNNDVEEVSSTGIDLVRFIASNNPGTPLAPIDKIASGGELSRFMLALKVALFDKFTKPTIIFDEIDTGIGGVVADAVGARLKTLSSVAQVITITHQPQVAGKADQHILVSKMQEKGRTSSNAKILSESERLEEIARMISGQEITNATREAAKDLLGFNKVAI